MLIVEPGMQHKVLDTWKCAYNTGYSPMAENGLVDTTTGTSTPSPSNTSSSSSSCNNIVTERPCSPLTSGHFSPDPSECRDSAVKLEKGMRGDSEFDMGLLDRGREASQLEQKLQELKAENEAYELRMSPSPRDGPTAVHQNTRVKEEECEARDGQDTPLDFSVKRRGSSFSGSVTTDESRASSSSPNHGTADYRGGAPSPEDGRDLGSADTQLAEDLKMCPKVSPTRDIVHNQFHQNNYSSHRRDFTPSPETKVKIKIERDADTNRDPDTKINSEGNPDNRQPHNQVQLPGASSLAPPLLGGLFPGLNPGFLAGKSAMGAFSQMAAAAAFMDPRNVGLNINNNNSTSGGGVAHGNNKKTTRPFKAYPKEALQMPLGGFFGAPGLSPSLIQQGIESGMFAGMNTEDLMTLYNQQLQLLREKQVSSSTPTLAQGQKGSSSPPMSPRLTNGSTDSQHENHGHLQHHKYRSEQSPPHHLSSNHQYLPTSNNVLTSHHHSNGSASPVENSTSYPAPASTLVSSTSPSPAASSNHNGNSNSRKRPRSLPDEQKDAAYWERRRKNNDAAKRSRDARRAKEDEIALRAALLEQENIKLRVEVASLKTETSRLRCLLYNS